MNICDIIHYIILLSFVFILLLDASLSISYSNSNFYSIINYDPRSPNLNYQTQLNSVPYDTMLCCTFSILLFPRLWNYHITVLAICFFQSRANLEIFIHIISIYLSMYLCIYLSMYLCMYLFIYVSMYISIYLSITLSLNLFISISISLSVSFFFSLLLLLSLSLSFLLLLFLSSSPLSVLRLFISSLYSVSSNNFIRCLISSRRLHCTLSCLYWK